MKKWICLLLCVCLIGIFGSCSKKEEQPQEPEIDQIRSICNLATLECHYHNVAKSEKTAGSGLSGLGEVDRKFWVEYTGVVKIGIDMSKVNMTVDGNTVVVSIPDAELMGISDIDENDLDENSYISSGDSWFNKNKISVEDQISAIQHAQKTMEESVKSNKTLLLNAQNRAKDLIKNYIVQLGEISGVDYEVRWEYITDTE